MVVMFSFLALALTALGEPDQPRYESIWVPLSSDIPDQEFIILCLFQDLKSGLAYKNGRKIIFDVHLKGEYSYAIQYEDGPVKPIDLEQALFKYKINKKTPVELEMSINNHILILKNFRTRFHIMMILTLLIK